MDGNETLMTNANFSLLLELDREKWQLLMPVTIFLVILMVLGIIGNCLVGYVWRTKMKRSSTNTCVLLLAFFDLLTCIIGIPLDIYGLTNHYTFDKPFVCKLFRFLIDFNVYGSITVLIFIAIIRYVKVCRPLTTFPVKSRGVVIASLCCGLGLSWPVLILHGLEIKPTQYPGINGQDCGIDEPLKGSIYANVYFSVLGFTFLSSCGLLAVLYICIGYHIFKRNRRKTLRLSKSVIIKDNGEDHGKDIDPRSKIKQDARKTVTRNSLMFFAITLAFILSFLPSLTMLAIKSMQPHVESTVSDWHFIAYMFLFRTYFINNCINPLLYGFWNKNFRKECVTLFTNHQQSCRGEKVEHSLTQNFSNDVIYSDQLVKEDDTNISRNETIVKIRSDEESEGEGDENMECNKAAV